MHRSIAENQDGISKLCRRYNVRRLDVFGSAASQAGFRDGGSDADFLVEFFTPSKLRPLDEYLGLRAELSSLLGRPVDLIEDRAVRNPYLRKAMDQGRELLFAA